MPKRFLILFIPILILTCKPDDDTVYLDCSTVLCAAVDNTIYLQFLNPNNDDDLLYNGTIDANQIEVVNENNQEITFTVEEYPTMGMFLAIPVSTESFGQKSFTIDFEEDDSFTVNFETSFSKGGECCGPYTVLEHFDIDNYSYDLVEPSPLPLFNKIYIANLD